MKFTAKVFSKPGTEIEASDEDGQIFKGFVEQSNPDGAMIVKLAGRPFSEFVWAPIPEAPVVEKKFEITQSQMDGFEAEMDRRLNVIAEKNKEAEVLNAIITDLKTQLAAAQSVSVTGAGQPAVSETASSGADNTSNVVETPAAAEEAPAKKKK